MLDDIEWTQVGGTHTRGKNAVVGVCEESSKYLAGVRTTFHRFKVMEAGDGVVSTVEPSTSPRTVVLDGRFLRLDDFAGGKLAAITSYTVEPAEPTSED